MAWRELTTDDLRAALSGPEETALRTKALATGQGDPVDQALAGAVSDARGRIAAFRGNKLGSGTTVPDTLVHHVIAIARWRMLTRLNVESLLTDSRKAEWESAERTLRDVAAGKVSIEQPADVDSEPRASVRPRINGRQSAFKRAQQDGI